MLQGSETTNCHMRMNLNLVDLVALYAFTPSSFPLRIFGVNLGCDCLTRGSSLESSCSQIHACFSIWSKWHYTQILAPGHVIPVGHSKLLGKRARTKGTLQLIRTDSGCFHVRAQDALQPNRLTLGLFLPQYNMYMFSYIMSIYVLKVCVCV